MLLQFDLRLACLSHWSVGRQERRKIYFFHGIVYFCCGLWTFRFGAKLAPDAGRTFSLRNLFGSHRWSGKSPGRQSRTQKSKGHCDWIVRGKFRNCHVGCKFDHWLALGKFRADLGIGSIRKLGFNFSSAFFAEISASSRPISRLKSAQIHTPEQLQDLGRFQILSLFSPRVCCSSGEESFCGIPAKILADRNINSRSAILCPGAL